MTEPRRLPYHCEKLRADFNQPPCEKMIVKIKDRLRASPGSIIGPLEHCLECKGKNLIRREVSMEVATPKVGTVPAAVKGLIPGQFCKNHPDTLAKLAKNGRYMGLCPECLAERAANNSRMRGANKIVDPPVRQSNQEPEKIDVHDGSWTPLHPCPNHPDRERAVDKIGRMTGFCQECNAPPAPMYPCPNHPDRERVVGKNGVVQGFCKECLQENGRKFLIPGQGTRPGNITLAFPDRLLDLRQWIIDEADLNERTPAAQIFYLLKLAYQDVQA